MNLSEKLVGNFSMLLYILLTACSTILIHNTNQQISPLLSTFYTFIFCILIYNLFSMFMVNKFHLIYEYKFEIFLLNITTAICWIFTFYSLKFLSADLYLFTYLCAMPIASSVIYKTKVIKSIFLGVGLLLLVNTYHGHNLYFGFILAFLGGVSGTIYSIYSKRLSVHFLTIEILSIRFYFTAIITLFCCYYSHLIVLAPLNFYIKFSFLSIIAVILPLIFFQMGLKNLKLEKALSYLPFAPIACYFINLFLVKAPFSLIQLIIVAFLGLAMIYPSRVIDS